MSASSISQCAYDGTRYCVGKIMLRKSPPVMRTHSCGSSAPIGCIAWKPGITSSTPSSSACDSAMRGSVSNVAVSGGGNGRSTSHVSGTRFAGSCASRSWRIVVPVRACPTMTIGGTTSTSAISGCCLRHSMMPSRVDR